MAYVGVSRGAYDAQLFTDNREKLGAALGHDVSHTSDHAPEKAAQQSITPQKTIEPKQERSREAGLSL
jgi:hypothetical protein